MVVSAGVQFDVTVCLVSDICVGGFWLECEVEIGSGVDCSDRLHIMMRNEVTVVCVQMSLPALMHAVCLSNLQEKGWESVVTLEKMTILKVAFQKMMEGDLLNFVQEN